MIVSAPSHLRLPPCFLIAITLLAVEPRTPSNTVCGQDNTVAPTRTVACLIGVEKYQHVNPLQYITNDVKRLQETLYERGGLDANDVRLLYDAPHPDWDANKKNILSKLKWMIGSVTSEESLLIYFSGHGFRGDDGQLYLAPSDCRLNNLQDTSIPIAWLRDQLQQCNAAFTLLVIDACHAGAEGSSVVAHELGEPLRELPNVVTLCSSTGEQKSQIWEEKQQSLFSYWFCQGLRGHADADGDGKIDVDELYRYVHQHVERSATKRLGRAQTPVRIVRSGTEGVPVVMTLQALTLDQVLDDLADQIAWAAEENRLSRMAVLEFMEDSALGKVLGAQYGVLGRYCAAELQERLLERSGGEFRVADQSRLESALRDQNFSINSLGNGNDLQQLADNVGGLSALSLGSFHGRVNRKVNVRCRLVSVEDGDVLSAAGGVANLSDSEWGMLGGSGWIPPEQRQRPTAEPDSKRPITREVRTVRDERQAETVRLLDEQSQHPLQDPRFPFKVKLLVDGKERPGTFEQNPETGKTDYVVSFRRGEVYSIQVENHARRAACVRLLVDGLNTLPEKSLEKGIAVFETAPRVNLNSCRAWIIDPHPAGKPSRTSWVVSGFFSNTGNAGELYEFKVSDAQSSVAARRGFTDQVGLVTAAFYYPQGQPAASGTFQAMDGRGEAGTVFGRNRRARTDEGSLLPGELWGIVNIRYVLEE